MRITLNGCCKFISNIKFTNPTANEIVILHHNSYWIKKAILRDMASTVLAEQPKTFFVTPALFLLTLWHLRLIDWRDIGRNWSFRYLFQKIYLIYILACIEKTQAKVVLTFVDNSTFAQNLSRIDTKRTYFFIQNGIRTHYCVRDSLPPSPHPNSSISMTNFFCFGKREINLFTRYGHKVDVYLPVGSLIGGYYKSIISTSVARKKFDLCLVSQWFAPLSCDITKNDFSTDDFSTRFLIKFGTGLNLLHSFVLRLVKETGLSLVICMRNDNEMAEVTYYKKMFGEMAIIANSDFSNLSTYRVAEQSQLVMSMNSTILAEFFSWGHKVLWCNVPNDELYEMPEAGISYFHGNDYAAFKERVLVLLKMSQDDYEMNTRESARYIDNYNPENPPHEVIRAAVIKALSSKRAHRENAITHP